MVTLTHHTKEVNGLKMHYVEAGSGPPVILLHGFPETWFAWRKQIPSLAAKYRVIAPDLRGYGETAKPPGGYDKRTMARDIYELMKALGIEKAPIVGHDRGARVATRFAKDYPAATERLVVMDNIPTRMIFDRMDAKIARGHWFFIFNTVQDLPEALSRAGKRSGCASSSQAGATTRSYSHGTRSPPMWRRTPSPDRFAALLAIIALQRKM